MTMRKRDGLIFVVNDPEVLRSEDGKSFAVFGELKLDDPNARLQQSEAKKFSEQQMAQAQAAAARASASKEENKASASNEAPESEEGITASHIDMLMDHTQCTRNQAIRALRATNDDMVSAVL